VAVLWVPCPTPSTDAPKATVTLATGSVPEPRSVGNSQAAPVQRSAISKRLSLRMACPLKECFGSSTGMAHSAL